MLTKKKTRQASHGFETAHRLKAIITMHSTLHQHSNHLLFSTSLTTNGQSRPTLILQLVERPLLNAVLPTISHPLESMEMISLPYTASPNGHVNEQKRASDLLISKSTPTEQGHIHPQMTHLHIVRTTKLHSGQVATPFRD